MRHQTGAANAITDVAGLRVGHVRRLDDDWATGVSVVLCREGATAAVDVRGGGPGTRETDALEPTHLVQDVHAVVLAGGSAYGLACADGAMRWLGQRKIGLSVGSRAHHVVPIVPSAVLFDLPMGAWGNWPDADFGYRACAAAGSDHHETAKVEQGNVGAGTGAVAGSLKGGVGDASAVLADGTVVGALVAVNSAGSVIDPNSGLPWVQGLELAGEFGIRRPAAEEIATARRRLAERPGRYGTAAQPLNTTIGVLATDRTLTKAECERMAIAGQAGLARAVRPVHGLFDGDTLFALATGNGPALPADTGQWARELDELCATAADVVARAIVHGILAAGTVGEVMSFVELYPSAWE